MRKNRLTRREKRKRQKQTILISTVCLLFVMVVGYAAFSTNLSITDKGNIREKTYTPEQLKSEFCNTESGDGLYVDIYEDGKCTYKGANPNNYITFNNETWRIVSIDADNTIKIMRNESIGQMAWDTSDSCPVAYNAIKKENNLIIVDNVIFLAGDIYNGCNNWNYASLKTYLNENYYNELLENKNSVIAHDWKIGSIWQENNDLSNQISDENKSLWNGKIGLITASEYLRANTNTEQCGNLSINNANRTICLTTNWMYSSLNKWTISIPSSTQGVSNCIEESNFIWNLAVRSFADVYPSLYLSSDVVLSGSGTETDPYVITN